METTTGRLNEPLPPTVTAGTRHDIFVIQEKLADLAPLRVLGQAGLVARL